MRRLGRRAVLALGLGATAFLLQSFLVVLDKGLVRPLLGQAKPSTSAQTNGTRGAKPYTTWTTYSGGAHSSQYSALTQITKATSRSSRWRGRSR
jgi:hypothetical protein